MNRLISVCPCCNGRLHISTLQCENCGMELKNKFSMSVFDELDQKQYDFLMTFLKCRGSLKDVQDALGISYPTAKKQLDDLLTALDLAEPEVSAPRQQLDLQNISADRTSRKASEIIKAKLLDQGGQVTVSTARGLPCNIYLEPDGRSFTSDKLPMVLEFPVFDAIVDLLIREGGSARKGNGRNYKLGEPGCELNTVVGAVALYRGGQPGESVFDPVFVLAAVLEWASIAENGRGVLILNPEFMESEPDIESLKKKFENELREKAQRAARECSYTPSAYLNMLSRYGGVKTAKQLISSNIRTGNPSEGFLRLYGMDRVDLTMEESVCRSEYDALFSEEEKAYCRNLLQKE